jgi:hypothetical protein
MEDESAEAIPELLVPLDGGRPEWLPEEYFDRDSGSVRVHSIVKRNRDALAFNTKLSQELAELKKPPSPPEAGYKVSVPDVAKDAGIGDDHPLIKGVVERAGEYGWSQDQLDTFLSQMIAIAVPAPDDVAAALRSRWGAETRATIEANKLWASQFTDPAARSAALGLLTIADGHALVKAIRERSRPIATVGGGASPADAAPPDTIHTLQAMMRDPRYSPGKYFDPAYHREVTERFRRLYGE